ncbi:MAG: gamma-glutamyltransferase [Verrucomicrobia bacterium]|nr:gamma-glutamyltransferase [Verrucomicrobiota bacterium]
MWSLVTVALFLALSPTGSDAAPKVQQRGAVATVHPLASEAAMRAMESGGNAIDAAVVAGLTLGVVDGFNSGIGGGCFMVIHRADGSVIALDGREKAPAAATRDMFVRDGKGDSKLSQTGALAIGVPGSLAVYEHAIRHYGKLTLRQHLLAAAEISEKGFPLTRTYVQRLESAVKELRAFDAARSIFLTADGSSLEQGFVLRQPDLARSYRVLAEQGIGWFYGGDFAIRMERWMKSNGGIATAKDFQAYDFKLREAVRTTYRGHEIVGFPPPSSGGVHVGQILNILEQFDLKTMGAGSADFVHVVTEAMKLAFADRAFWLGDPDFVPVPRGLMSKEYAAKLAKRIDLRRASPVPKHDEPDGASTDVFGKHTTHFSCADADGNWVACTATVNTTFGSKVVIPGTGIVMNNQMDDFSIQPGVANAFGLLGAEANAVAPGKRPLSSMSPTIVLKEGRPVMAVGAAGGPTIISQTLLAILHVVDFGADSSNALAQARFHHQWRPDELRVEKRLPESVRAELSRRGHRVVVTESLGAAQVVAVDEKGKFSGVADPRGEGLGLAR